MKLRTLALVGLLVALLAGTVALGTTGPTVRSTASDGATSADTSMSTPATTTPRRTVPRSVPPPVTMPRQVLPLVPSLPRPVSPRSSAPTAAADPRPRTGAVIDARGPKGEGKAEVENGTSRDGVLTLAQNGRAVRSVYVRAGGDATLSGVRDGAYEVFFTTGNGWNGDLERFTIGQDYQRYPGTSDFTTTRTQYSIWSFSLQPVAGGDVTPQDVTPEQYPR